MEWTLLDKFHGNEPASFQAVSSVERAWGFRLPQDYREFMLRMNGGEGFIGPHYLIMWRVQELVQFNEDYQVREYAPGIYLFGSSGGGEGFGFDARDDNLRIVQVPFVGLDLRYAKTVADNLGQLFNRMHASHGTLL